MSYPGFGKESGPIRRPDALPSFGPPPSLQPLRGPPPPMLNPAPTPYVSPPKRPEAVGRMQPPLLSSDNSLLAVTSSNDPRPRESFPRRPTYQDFDNQTIQLPSATTLLVASRASTGALSDIVVTTCSHLVPRARSPLSYEDVYANDDNSSLEELPSYPGMQIGKHNGMVSQTPQFSHATPENFHSTEEFASVQPMKRSITDRTFSAGVLRPKSPSNYDNPIAGRSFTWTSHRGSLSSGGNNLAEHVDNGTPKPSKLLPPAQVNNINQGSRGNSGNNPQRPFGSLSPSNVTSEFVLSSASLSTHHSGTSSNHVLDEVRASKPDDFVVPKRTRSPPSSFVDQELQRSEEVDREDFAKAKRLARFREELSEPIVGQNRSVARDPKAISGFHETYEDRQMNENGVTELSRDFQPGSTVSDIETQESSGTITGLCPDMCPESERGERERKGDLDQYERVDGDRNQTSKLLAIKKYNRTAEREANLIRPMPVLLKTISHLLNLLNQPYDERFLGLYNFLWDRMRAVRMDLRMQHIFDLEAIRMLEQMIRLHIIAMHELCEYAKGEGFSEGFDAHLNIEQMNKTSAELFQLYDDHRKRGVNVSTEKEFRGYYALLKLDKHPGYKVEPAELSLDLAKMTQEIRQTIEVRFARDVARACRTGNFISFFRLSRKATFLQACLMHPHFSKMRSQALASLHSGLQGNQGLPVAIVAEWLAMEDEDIESLLEYYGFSLKEFEEPYMVKEGPFLGDEDFPTKQSKLVHHKRSSKIIDDVVSSHVMNTPPQVARNQLSKGPRAETMATHPVQRIHFSKEIDIVMADSVSVPSPKERNQRKQQQVLQPPLVSLEREVVKPAPGTDPFNHKVPGTGSLPKPQPLNYVVNSDWNFRNLPVTENPLRRNSIYLPSPSRVAQAERLPMGPVSYVPSSEPSTGASIAVDQAMVALQHHHSGTAGDDETLVDDEDKEVAESKLKLILRLWKRRSSKLKELREQRHMAASLALSSVSLGPIIRWNKYENGGSDKLQIDNVMLARFERQEVSWSKLNVADLTASILSSRNTTAKCLCWKISCCSNLTILENATNGNKLHTGHMSAARWLRAKLMPAVELDQDLVFSSEEVSIWCRWIAAHSSTDLTCCLSVIREVNYDSLEESVAGASAILFLLTKSISMEIQKDRLNEIVKSLPPGSGLPLLIVVDYWVTSISDGASFVAANLGLDEIDSSRISDLAVVFLFENEPIEGMEGFFSDQRLREGLEWLASESPVQPVVHCVHTNELVLNQWKFSLMELGQGDLDASPNDFIVALNSALDGSLSKVMIAASSNNINWPGPEIALLSEFSDEYRIAKRCLPCVGWSTRPKLEAIKSVMWKCKLPNFDYDISGLRRGCKSEMEVVNLKVQLENFLVGYLTEKCKIMGPELARTEVAVMLQKYVRLVLRSSLYFLVPGWDMIFRRIVNWRLMSLSEGEVAETYIREGDDVAPPLTLAHVVHKHDPCTQGFEYPSLDEMLEIGYSSEIVFSDPNQRVSIINTQSQASQTPGVDGNEAASEVAVESELDDMEMQYRGKTADKDAEKLRQLLLRCNILQNTIDEKLALYF
ncbi:hypothetical protein MLD38_039667 [Melastoma candidum]|uniref:Uncharacterized protein n=1 Tax=Melastoma candidum TaxID=119954 RepID=A0ACB9L385_9MYRT|nr:hypothetical protein MLD38_039667 [Melastoma candidum]